MAVGFCPECGEGVKLGGRPQEGQRVTCAECGANLEVISLRPLELDWVFDEPTEEWEEDWSSSEEWEEDWESEPALVDEWGPGDGFESDWYPEDEEEMETEMEEL